VIAHPILWDSGVFLPGLQLWLDPRLPRPRAVVSHAHSDHVAPHPVGFMTPATGRLVSHRRTVIGRVHALPYGTPFSLGGARLSLHPAGHVLGSAQTLLETDFGRVLYTGDLKLRAGLTAAAASVVPADVLVLESTFGKPRYRFPDSGEVVEAVLRWCLRVQAEGATPVLLGYSLGKGQEVLAALAGAGFDLVLHPVLAAVTDVYRELGCAFPEYRRLGRDTSAGSVVIVPPQARGALRTKLPNHRAAALTGWAMDASLKDRLQVDAVFPLSDHADFDELCRYAEAVQPQMTYTVLGFDEDLALALRRRGLRAAPLRQPQQLSLF
jgi:predicted metal-dependent RNase